MSNSLEKLISEYDKFYQKFYKKKVKHEINAKIIESMIKCIPSKNSKILEYGCANGFNLRFLHREGFTNLTGVDGYIENKSTTEIKYTTANFSCKSCIYNSKDEFPGVYDFIFCRGVLQQGATSFELIKNSEEDVLKIITVFEKLLTKNKRKDGIIWFSEGPVRDWVKLFKSKNFTITTLPSESNVYMARRKK
jgi:2-polyprenyl-3-methyl-5-hydroxy-6-metoxy-1,4-benzoquinol methylase